MNSCFKCNRTEEEVMLFDGIYFNEAVVTCEKCALLEGIPLVKVPSTNQLKTSEKSDYVYKRLRRIAGFKDEKPKKSIFEELKEIEEKTDIGKVDESPIKLVENFHWIIQHERRRKGLTNKQLAGILGESETALRLIERNSLPENALPVFRKLEQYFRIKLIKDDSDMKGSWVKRGKVEEKLVEKGTEVEMIQPIKAEVDQQESIALAKPSANTTEEPAKVLDFKKRKLDNITISDLKEMNRIVQADFPTKSSEQIGKEQLEDFGKPQTDQTKSWSAEYFKKRQEKRKQVSSFSSKQAEDNVPTISELMEKKRAIRKSPEEDLLGKDIEIVEEQKESSNSIKPVESDEIEIIEFDDKE